MSLGLFRSWARVIQTPKPSPVYLCYKSSRQQKKWEHLIQRECALLTSHCPHLHASHLSSKQRRGLSYPKISSGTSVLEQPRSLFSFVAAMELNALPRRGWRAAFCDSYLCEMHLLSKTSLFCENWQRWRTQRV